jgi:hypothetical protein
MKTLMIFLIFLLIGAFFIISGENLKINKNQDRALFFKSYAAWIDSLFLNSKSLGGYVVKLEWLPKE